MINYNTGAAGHYHVGIEPGDTEQLRRIIEVHLPEAMNRFARKNRAYGDRGYPLGPAGQFPELKRKIDMLQALIWDRRESAGDFDNAKDLCEDFIGHMLMLLDCLALDRGEPERGGLSTDLVGNLEPVGWRERVVASTPSIDEEWAAHQIREAKGGAETWVDGSVVEPPGLTPQNTGEEPPSAAGRRLVATGNHALRVAFQGEARCPWRYHGGKDDGMRNQCVGLAGHERAVVDREREDYHINADLEAWQA